MNEKDTSIRLKEYMTFTGLKSIDIVKKCQPFCKQYNEKLEKNHFSQYLSGKSKPNQKKLFILSKALNVSPAWLMGFDVPMNEEEKEELTPPQAKIKIEEIIEMTSDLSEQEKMLLRGTLELICKDKDKKA